MRIGRLFVNPAPQGTRELARPFAATPLQLLRCRPSPATRAIPSYSQTYLVARKCRSKNSSCPAKSRLLVFVPLVVNILSCTSLSADAIQAPLAVNNLPSSTRPRASQTLDTASSLPLQNARPCAPLLSDFGQSSARYHRQFARLRAARCPTP